jgi:hypothetical protein
MMDLSNPSRRGGRKELEAQMKSDLMPRPQLYERPISGSSGVLGSFTLRAFAKRTFKGEL